MNNPQDFFSGVRLGEDGIWQASSSRRISYPNHGNEDCLDVESASFWFRHRNNCISSLIATNPPKAGGLVVDVGGGNGFVALHLADQGLEVVLLEPGLNGARNAKARGLKTVICATLEDSMINPGSVAAIGLFDVLEHVEDQVAFLRRIHSALCDRGRLYLSVPAFPILWSRSDDDAGHFRRYLRKTLERNLKEGGFAIDYSTYIFRYLPPAIFFRRSLPYVFGLGRRVKSRASVRRDHAADSEIVARFLSWLSSQELSCIRRKRPMKFGGSCLAAASKL